MGPPLPHRRPGRGADLRVLHGDGGGGHEHRARHDRADGRGEHVPRARARGQDGDDARPHQRWAGDARHRRGLVRDRAPGLRHPLRQRPRRTAALAPRRAAHHARHARWGPAERRRSGVATPPRTSSTCPRRSSGACPSSSAGAGGRSPCAWWPRYADACNIGGPAEHLAEKEATLLAHCAAVGRDEREIERTVAMGTPSSATRRPRRTRALDDIFAHNGGAAAWQGQPVGTVDEVVAFCEPFVRAGLPPPRVRLPVAVRRGDDDPPRDRGPAATRSPHRCAHRKERPMPDMTAPLKLGANLWNQYTDWPAFLEGMLRAEELGYDSLWTWDHVYPIIGDWEGPALETYTAMAAVAARTSRATIGHLVGANTFRNPALLAKMVTTIDHISGGRAVLGIGAAWMEPEHTAFGFEFGDRPGTRLRWLEEALGIVRGMLDGDAADGRRRALSHRGRPQPAGLDPAAHPHPHRRQRARRSRLRLVAQYADMNNLGNPIEACSAQRPHPRRALPRPRPGRERDRAHRGAPARRRPRHARGGAGARCGAAGHGRCAGRRGPTTVPGMRRPTASSRATPTRSTSSSCPTCEAGYRHLICGFPPPYDEETMRRIAVDVRPRLEALIAALTSRSARGS